MKDLEQEFELDEEVKNYTALMKLHLTDAKQLRKRGLPELEYQHQAEAIKGQIEELSNRQAKHPAIRKWQDFFIEKQRRLFQWCQNAKIPAENNYAAREIRKIVIARQMSYGSQSKEGAKTQETPDKYFTNLEKTRSQSAR